MKARILHITSWFNKSDDSTDAVFIKNQIDSLSPFCENDVLHLTFERSVVKFFKPERSTPLHNTTFGFERYTLGVMTNKWIEIEKRTFYFLKEYISRNWMKYDVINFYIAYPNAVRIDYFNDKYKKIKFTITEHWSAYRMNFNLSKNSPGRKRIATIFDHGNDLFVVSDALGKDIRSFTGKPVSYQVVPNILETDLFKFADKSMTQSFLLSSVNYWSDMKNPFVLVDAIKILTQRNMQVRLILGGEGAKYADLKKYVEMSGVAHLIELTGRLSRLEVSELLGKTHIYIQSSVYETFSVICMEALATGTPVIAHNVGGMKEFISDNNGILVDDMDAMSWADSIELALKNYTHFDRKKMAEEIYEKFRPEKVGRDYFTKLIRGISKFEGVNINPLMGENNGI